MTSLPLLLTLSLVMTTALILVGLNVFRADRVHRRLVERLDRATNGLVIVETDQKPKAVNPLARFQRPLGSALAIFGVDLARAPDYPVPWWAILLGALVMARVVVMLIAMVFGGWSALLWPAMTALVARTVFATIHARRSSALLNQFPEALATIVRCVRVGIPVQEALRIIGRDMPKPTGAEFTRIADQVAIGTPLDQALRSFAERSRIPEYGFFATALSLQARAGGGLAQTLETLSEVIRKRVAMKARGYAMAAEARTSALILGIIPIVAGVAIELLQPSYLEVLFVTRKGHIIFGMAVGMLVLGSLTMRSIIRRSLS
ncbi:MAG: type II secretion system F family protein [Acidiphilium sp.]|nr:type II secretion system F family protein [Acidiphilium sp.]MDD4936305.1 type II secretion system F family protein [Acidiphilium sp.]